MKMDSELAALADGTLAPERRAAVLARVESDPELAAALADQRAALAAIRATANEPASDALRAAVQAMARPRAVARRRPWRLAVAGATALAAAAVLLLGQGAPGPSVADAARVALAPAAAAAPGARPADGTLAASVDGVAYPYWEDSAGWRAVGARRDVLRGHVVRTVIYARGAQRIGYSIAAGAPLTVAGGRIVERDNVPLRVLRSGDTTIVTWLRAGHTCVIAARNLDPEVLLRLAAWRA